MTAELRLLQDDEAWQVFPLPQGVLTIGRDPTNHIQLDSAAVSARHARIFTVGDSSTIQDISRDAGIFVNDEEIVRRELCDQDIIYIGSHRFQFLNPTASTRPGNRSVPEQATPATKSDTTPTSRTPATDPVIIAQPPHAALGTEDGDAPDATPAITETGSASPAHGGRLPALDETDTAAEDSPPTQVREARSPRRNIYHHPTRADEDQEDCVPAAKDEDDRAAAAAFTPAPGPLTVVIGGELSPQPGPDPHPDSAAVGPSGGSESGLESETVVRPDRDSPDPLADGDVATGAKAAPAARNVTAPCPDAEPPNPAIDDDFEVPAAPVPTDWGTPETGTDAAATTDDAWRVVDDNAEWAATPPTDRLRVAENDIDTVTAPPPAEPDPLGPAAVIDGTLAELSSTQATADRPGFLQHQAAEQAEAMDFPPFSAGIEVLGGPNRGKRLIFSRPRIVLGKGGGRSVIIECHQDEYRIRSADRGAAATLNGTLLLQDPVPLTDGDRIEFAELSALFFQRSRSSDQL